MSSASATRWRISALLTPFWRKPVRDVLGDGHVREQSIRLEDGVDVALVRRGPGNRLTEIRSSPDVGSSKPASMRSVVVLPHPLGPSSDRNSPGCTVQVDVVDSGEVAEHLDHVDELDGPGLAPGASRFCHALAPLPGVPVSTPGRGSWARAESLEGSQPPIGGSQAEFHAMGCDLRPSRDLWVTLGHGRHQRW